MLGGGGLGLLILLTAITLLQPHRITTNHSGQIALRIVGTLLLGLTLVALSMTLAKVFARPGA